jgi:hypothetical protein
MVFTVAPGKYWKSCNGPIVSYLRPVVLATSGRYMKYNVGNTPKDYAMIGFTACWTSPWETWNITEEGAENEPWEAWGSYGGQYAT